MSDAEEKIFEDVREILVRILKLDAAEVTMESKLLDELGIDSVDFWDIVAKLDKRFKYRISNKEAMTLNTVKDLVAVIKKNAKTL